MNDLNAQLLTAHEEEDSNALITLYSLAAAQASDIDTACFYLTHAYIFALELGDSRAGNLRAQLVSHGRETPA
ncbi:hypothetical protein [uncultured Sulfitobacter sp.]|uniref:hypothetical protein n=1 Tax=uncultured Sulfitobacter sp. TaxID=191468 RepID=UPI00261A6F53|nr:hypothetical protein [uncultured Sulfitobacter sp.]